MSSGSLAAEGLCHVDPVSCCAEPTGLWLMAIVGFPLVRMGNGQRCTKNEESSLRSIRIGAHCTGAGHVPEGARAHCTEVGHVPGEARARCTGAGHILEVARAHCTRTCTARWRDRSRCIRSRAVLQSPTRACIDAGAIMEWPGRSARAWAPTWDRQSALHARRRESGMGQTALHRCMRHPGIARAHCTRANAILEAPERAARAQTPLWSEIGQAPHRIVPYWLHPPLDLTRCGPFWLGTEVPPSPCSAHSSSVESGPCGRRNHK